MNRLFDYFVVLGFDFDNKNGISSPGKVYQRFPELDWPNAPFNAKLPTFCQPQGWKLSSTQLEPSFFVTVLTDSTGNRRYCGCLSFYEPIFTSSLSKVNKNENNKAVIGSGSNFPTFKYAPKCLTLISRHYFVETLRNCLGIVYTVYIEETDIPLEKLVGNLLCIEVPSPGVPINFTIGANDSQSLQPPLSPTVPVTGTTVAQLFERLGIHNVIILFTAVITDCKILFQSKSYSLLQDSCHALVSLIYPFIYKHVYIPILPCSEHEYLNTPTPFIMGCHSSLKYHIEDLLDVIIAHLDAGCIYIPRCVHIPKLDDSTYNQLVDQLCSVITPHLSNKDDAFSTSHKTPSPPVHLDKEIRAIFIRFLAQILQGYRTCLQVVRLCPKPVITFHKASFLGMRNLVENEFVISLLESMFFDPFLEERKLPFRVADLFDDLYATIQDTLKIEQNDPDLIIKHIKELASRLFINETPKEPFTPIIPRPTDLTISQARQSKFPLLKNDAIQEIIDRERILSEITSTKMINYYRPLEKTIICSGLRFTSPFIFNSSSTLPKNTTHKSELISNFVQLIFSDKISEAKKDCAALLMALDNKVSRLSLVLELSRRLNDSGQTLLNPEQFELIVRLLNFSLQQDCYYLDRSTSGRRLGLGDVNGLAAAILPLSISFYKKIGNHVNQHVFTCLQAHSIWDNISFWESTFYQKVERKIISICRPIKMMNQFEHSPLDIAAEQLRLSSQWTEKHIKDQANNEESIVYCQAIEFVNMMVGLKVPLDISTHEKNLRNIKLNLPQSESKQYDYNFGISGSGSGPGGGGGGGGGLSNREIVRDEKEAEKEVRDFDNESGFEEGPNGNRQNTFSDISSNVIKFVSTFVDKVCPEAGVSEEHIRALHQIIPSVVALQCEASEEINKENKKMTLCKKLRISPPSLLPDEELVINGLRAYLLEDDRYEVKRLSLSRAEDENSITSGSFPFPAEGALFLTNFRVIFKGRPCDIFTSESFGFRSVPVTTLVKDKKKNSSCNYLIAAIDQYVNEGAQISSNFQLIKIAFDEEVSQEEIEICQKLVKKTKTPPYVFQILAYGNWQSHLSSGTQVNISNTIQRTKDKNSTIKGFAKKTLKKTAAVTGIPIKNKRKNKYIVPGLIGNGSAKTLPHLSGRQLVTIDLTEDNRSVDDNTSLSSNCSNLFVGIIVSNSLKEDFYLSETTKEEDTQNFKHHIHDFQA